MDPVGIKLALEHKEKEIGICLLQDAVYFACKGKKGNEMLASTINRGIQVFAAKKDVELRGLTELIHPEVKSLSYNEIIDIVLDFEAVVNI